jgi:hypothetical protein
VAVDWVKPMQKIINLVFVVTPLGI